MKSDRARYSERGVTLVEATVVLAVVVFLLGTVITLAKSTADGQKYSERLGRAIEINQSLLNTMRYELGSTVMLFQGDTYGDGYWSLLDFARPPMPTSSLPVADPNGIFEKETATATKSGNALMFARQAWTTEFTCLSGKTYRIDVYRVVSYYLTLEGVGPQPGSSIGLNLCQYVSEPLADGEEIDRIFDPADLQEVLEHLVTGSVDALGNTYTPVDLVWRRDLDSATTGALRQIDASTKSLSATPLSPRPPTWILYRDTERSSDGLLYYRYFSVATNYSLPSWGVGRFSMIDNSSTGFPHGFEIQITGPSSARQILLHTTIVTTNQGGMQAHSDLKSTVFVHDV